MTVIDINYDKLHIGTVEFSNDILDETKMSDNDLKISGIEKAEIYIYGNEGKMVPHFHIVSHNKPDVCIMITDNRYFSHGKNKGILNSRQCKELNDWMHQQSKFNALNNNWSLCAMAWGFNSNTIIDSSNSNAPDYSVIKPYK